MDNFKFLNSVVDNLKIASVFILDKSGVILNINEGVQKTFGYNKSDLYGKYFGVLFIQEDLLKKKPQIEIATVLEKGEATDVNYLLHKSGKKIWVNGESAIAENDEGEKFILKLVYDTNDQKELELFLFKKNNALIKTNNELNTFVYASSHDLKAPINNIEALMNYLRDVLPEGALEKENVRNAFSMIDVSIEKFKATIHDLANTGKLVAEHLENNTTTHFEETLVDVKSNLQEIIQKYKPIISEDFSRAPYLNFSKKNLRSIFHNLLSNALKFSSISRIPKIEISSENISGKTILHFSDNGIGIKVEDQGKIFTMYERVHDSIEGTGVGLNIIKMIMDNAGGKIEVNSIPGEGTTFSLHFNNDDL